VRRRVASSATLRGSKPFARVIFTATSGKGTALGGNRNASPTAAALPDAELTSRVSTGSVRGVGGEVRQAAVPVLVGAPAIPEQDEWPADLTSEMAKKSEHLGPRIHSLPPKEDFEAYVDAAMQAPLEAMIEAQRSLIEADLLTRLGEITVPTLIIHGARDHGRKIEHAQTLHEGILGSRLVVIEASGHSPMLETPKEFDQALHAFLEERSW
jgi:pimeloyl-ACP methyl ester carboxylesterase